MLLSAKAVTCFLLSQYALGGIVIVATNLTPPPHFALTLFPSYTR